MFFVLKVTTFSAFSLVQSRDLRLQDGGRSKKCRLSKVLTLFGFLVSLKRPFKFFGITPRVSTTIGINFIFTFQSLDISLAKSWYFSCFSFSLLSTLPSPGTAMSMMKTVVVPIMLTQPGSRCEIINFTNFLMDNPVLCVVLLFVISLGKLAALFYTILLAFSTHSVQRWHALMFDIFLIIISLACVSSETNNNLQRVFQFVVFRAQEGVIMPGVQCGDRGNWY